MNEAQIPTTRGARRGQTTIDFVVAIGVFLLVLGFAAAFLPEMYAPFDDDPQRPLVADRTADRLVGTLATDPSSPSSLNETCALAVLRNETACGYDAREAVHERLGVSARYRVNVTLQRNLTDDTELESLCVDELGVTDCSSDGDALAVGPAVPDDRSSVDTAYRTVYLDGRDATMVVSVW